MVLGMHPTEGVQGLLSRDFVRPKGWPVEALGCQTQSPEWGVGWLARRSLGGAVWSIGSCEWQAVTRVSNSVPTGPVCIS